MRLEVIGQLMLLVAASYYSQLQKKGYNVLQDLENKVLSAMW
jgi:hypothetical protein